MKLKEEIEARKIRRANATTGGSPVLFKAAVRDRRQELGLRSTGSNGRLCQLLKHMGRAKRCVCVWVGGGGGGLADGE
jgi:hypothetical protein